MLLYIILVLTIGILMWMRTKKGPNEPPMCPGALPLLGNTLSLLGGSERVWKNLSGFYAKCRKENEIHILHLGIRNAYLITDPEEGETILNASLQRDELYDITKGFLGTSLIAAPVPLWKSHRKLLSPAFSLAVAYSFTDIINLQARRLVKNLSVEVGKGPFDQFIYMGTAVLETACLTAFGVGVGDNVNIFSEYLQGMHDLLDIFMERFQKFWWLNDSLYQWSLLKKKEEKLHITLHRLTDTLMKNRKIQNFKTNTVKETTSESGFTPLLNIILDSSKEIGEVSDEEIRQHLDTITISAYDTTATTITLALLLVGSSPEVQQKIADELHQVFGNDDRDVTKQDLAQLTYLDAVVREVMRLYPVIPVSARVTDKDLKLKKYTIPAGSTCFVSTYDMHRHPSFGPDFEEFRPGRWFDANNLPVKYDAFCAFGRGRRMCLGKSYALLSVKIFLIHLFCNYIIRGDHTKLITKMYLVLKPHSGYHISIEKRDKLSH